MKTIEQKRNEAVERSVASVESFKKLLKQPMITEQQRGFWSGGLERSKKTLKQTIGNNELPTALQYAVNQALHG